MGIEIPISTKQPTVENRQAKRYRYRGDATVRRLELGEPLPGCILDLSARGCLLRLPDLTNLEVDAVVDMSINSKLVAFRAVGSVRHCSPNRHLIGISFMSLSRRGEADLLELIAELESAEEAGRGCVQEIRVSRLEERPAGTQDAPR